MSRHAKRVLVYIGLTFLLSWSLIGIYALSGGKWRGVSGGLIAFFYMLIPAFSTIIIQKFIYRENVINPLGIRFLWNRWWTIAWVLPPVAALATFSVSLLLPDVTFSPDFSGILERMAEDSSAQQLQRIRQQLQDLPLNPFLIPFLQTLFAGITINALISFGEELGWRGFLQNELKKLGFWKSSLSVGFIWGIWHAPTILMGHNYPNHRIIGIFMMTLWTILLSPLIAWVRYRGNSVVVAAIIHGTINASPGIALLMVQGGNELLVGLTGLAGIIVFSVICIIIWIFERFILTTSTTSLMQSPHPEHSEEL
ncbi:MAG: CPBP family intramembrane glutamic endopeptidase [Fibrobacterota bacterium]